LAARESSPNWRRENQQNPIGSP